ncbi:hypothetical protein Ade02nite_49860 [Paractinoplanes deccanensis]|uniref:Uncharacterized protein n=1 Tax=Paractinoplanes deccanensis TaxID=113561 RepID=A0ABQ3Y8R4_9ACTN|nr:hypothetical protein [Actinoplanes deccanensis]GID76345.1 hypothetical protein Ade02nite_49860 [Actinoplanes deccanensis]
MPEAPADDPGISASAVTTLRLIAGWAFVGLALLNLAMGLDSFPYVAFHLVLLLAGLAMLGLQRVGRRPRRAAWLTGGAVAALGLVVSALPEAAVDCCSREYSVRHGFPFTMIARNPGGWHADGARILIDVLFWALAGMLVLIAVARLTPAPAGPAPARLAAPPRRAEHAEERGTRTADDENVRGLP